jgi:hypothetical protein
MKRLLPVLALFALFACTKKNGSPNGPAPVIGTIFPDSGHYATVLTIIGSHFSPVAAENMVLIDSVKATVLHATADSLVVSVPSAGTGHVVVVTDAGSTRGPLFTYLTDIVVSGRQTDFTYGANYSVAVYWNNGHAIRLTDGHSNAEALCITGAGNDIYIGGHEYTGMYRIARIWKNGVATAISGQTQNADINALVLVGKDVYAAGYLNTGGKDMAVVWKNGVVTVLSDTSRDCYATGMAVSGNDIYVCGYSIDPLKLHGQAILWKNGMATYLSDSAHDAWANAIAVSGTDVWVAGCTRGNGWRIPTYWKNGAQIIVPSGLKTGAFSSVSAGSNAVYMTGTLTDPYSNNTSVLVYFTGYPSYYIPPPPGGYAGGNSVMLDGPDVYVSGVVGYPYPRAHYWKNGVDSLMDSGSDKVENITTGLLIRR